MPRKEHMEEVSKNPYGKKPRKVKCYDKHTGELVAEYPSVSAASRSTGNAYSRAAITYCCQGLQKTAYGYKWEYAD